MLESFVWLCQTARPWAGNRLPTSQRAGCSRGTQQIVIHNGDEAATGKRSRARQNSVPAHRARGRLAVFQGAPEPEPWLDPPTRSRHFTLLAKNQGDLPPRHA